MKQRSPIAVLLLPIITLGIYGIVWFVKTKIEMNKEGAAIPTAWLLIIPFVNIWWLWKYCEGVEEVTQGKTTTVVAFLLLFGLGLVSLTIVGMAIVQDAFNKLVAVAPLQATAPASEDTTPTAPTPPAPTPPVVQ